MVRFEDVLFFSAACFGVRFLEAVFLGAAFLGAIFLDVDFFAADFPAAALVAFDDVVGLLAMTRYSL